MPGIVALRKQFAALPEEVRNHFAKLEDLLENKHLEIALAYIFMLLEQGRYRAVKCVLVRNYRCSAELVDQMYKDHEFTRKTFTKTISDLLAVNLKSSPYNVLESAETARDSLFHGRRPKDESLREAISNSLTFVTEFGEKVRKETTKNPFGDLRGLSSKLTMLSKNQAKWIILGVKMSADGKP